MKTRPHTEKDCKLCGKTFKGPGLGPHMAWHKRQTAITAKLEKAGPVQAYTESDIPSFEESTEDQLAARDKEIQYLHDRISKDARISRQQRLFLRRVIAAILVEAEEESETK